MTSFSWIWRFQHLKIIGKLYSSHVLCPNVAIFKKNVFIFKDRTQKKNNIERTRISMWFGREKDENVVRTRDWCGWPSSPHSTQAFQAAGSSHLFKLLIKDIYQRFKTIQTRKSTYQNKYLLFTHGANFVRLSLIILRYMVCLFVFIRKTSKRLKRSNPIDVIMVSRMIENRLWKSIITNRKIYEIFSFREMVACYTKKGAQTAWET